MNEVTRKLIAPPGPGQLLRRLLDEPHLVQAIQGLAAPILGKLIQHVGLEDSGEIIALATPAQLAGVFDEDLWRTEQPGRDETFDPHRFAVWLEVMLEMGSAFVAKRLLQMDADFVTLALSRHVLVVDAEEMALAYSEQRWDDADQAAQDLKSLESTLNHEFDDVMVISRNPDGWDSILEVLLAMDAEDHQAFHRMLSRLCFISMEQIEDNGGLHNVLSAQEQLESDVAGDREERRAGEGHLSPSNAAALLRLARTTPLQDLVDGGEPDAITKAYFRSLVKPVERKKPAAHPGRTSAQPVVDLLQLLQSAEVITPVQTPLLLTGTQSTGEVERAVLIRSGLAELMRHSPPHHVQRMQELSYLANALVAGASHDGRALRAVEAADAAICACNLGLEHLVGTGHRTGSLVLKNHNLVQVFKVGWNLLHHKVTMHVAGALVDALTGRTVRTPTPVTWEEQQLARLHTLLKRHVSAQQPWAIRAELGLLGSVLDQHVVHALRAMIDECPAVPRAMLKDDPPQDGRISGECHFISTRAEVIRVQAFASGLAAWLRAA